ncbi:universal stress protein [Ekhidna sp.]|uniref:universal stress protein n=1 Tax=Ekhidna sp. TaxID=2608089 RepID=UPI0032995D17
MISSILIPTDFSPASWNATQVGLELSRLNTEAILSFLHIYPLAARHTQKDIQVISKQKLEEVEKRMNQLAVDLIEQPEQRIKNMVLSGNVEETMIRFIRENHFDLVIVGINGNGQNNEIGSHTVSVIKESGIPVMIVPNRL